MPREESSVRQSTSQPGATSPPPQNTSDGLIVVSGPDATSSGPGARAIQAKRVAFSGSSSIPSASTVPP